MMKTTTSRSLGIMTILAVLLSALTALPAVAATPAATATLPAADKVLRAGETHNFNISFKNDEAAGTLGLTGVGATIDVIQVASPTFILDTESFVVPETIGTFKTFVDDGTITLYDGTLGPQQSLVVPFTAAVKNHFSTDRGSTFYAQVSQVGDTALGPVSGNLSFVADILQVNTIKLTQPDNVAGFESLSLDDTGVDDNSVTANQGGVTIEVGVTNNGGVAKDITATLTGVTGSASKVVAAHSSDVIVVSGVQFGSGNVTVDAKLNADGADRNAADDPVNRPVTVQAAPTLVKSSDITPDYVGLGSHGISASLTKGGVPAIQFGAAVTTTSKVDSSAGPGFTIPSKLVGRNSQSPTITGTLDFGLLVNGQPQFTAGMYDVTVSISGGVDDNGKPFANQVIDLGDIFFDPLAPIFSKLGFSGQAPFVGVRDAVTHGESFTYNLTLLNDGESLAPCVGCTVSLAVVDASNPDVSYATKTVITNSSGVSSGTIGGSAYPNLAHTDVKLKATALDKGGNPTGGVLPPTESFATVSGDIGENEVQKISLIDTLPPGIDPASPEQFGADRLVAYTGGFDDAQNRMVIDVISDEPIAQQGIGTNALDWDVDGHTVTEVAPRTFGTGAAAIYGFRLTLREQLGKNEVPGVAYDPVAASGRIRDRVEANLIAGAIETVVDNIVPALPTLDTVDDATIWTDEEFHTNLASYSGVRNDDLTPNEDLVLSFTGVEGGATLVVTDEETGVELARESNASTAEFTTQEIRIALTDLENVPAFGFTDVLTLTVFATDTGGNLSTSADHVVNLDRLAPDSAGIVAIGEIGTNEITIAATEDLRYGRSDPIDWKVKVSIDGDEFNVGIETVTPGDSAAERVLKITQQWNIIDGSELVHARFAYVGSDNARPADPAGNRLPLLLNFLNAT